MSISLQDTLAMKQLELNLLKQTTHCLKTRQLTKFDPIVGENTCQWRAIHIIESSLDENLMREAFRVHEEAKTKFIKVNQFRNKPLKTVDVASFDISVSERLHYCTLSYFLTCGKFFQMRSNGAERSGIDLSRIQHHLCRSAPLNLISRMELTAKEEIASLTIKLIQSKAEWISDRYVRKIFTPSRLFLSTSCALHNFKATFETLEKMGIPIVVTEYGTGALLNATPEEISDEKPIFQIEVFPNKEINIREAVQANGIARIALACIAVLPQFSEDDDISALPEDGQEEILRYRKMEEMRQIFRIAHTHATTKQELLKR